ncbi:hypothetical protein FRC12_015135 [Ceratobasidium sp. 428]|nr:hypothetical protein FRC12_015135 [Ceratobasidium sp. 428]
MSLAQASPSPQINVPFDRLPENIMFDIFLLVWRGRGVLDGTWRGMHERRIPYILASVSRYWRAIVLAMPILWTFVDLSQIRTEHLATHLARSKDLSIHVDLFLDEESHIQNLRESLRILGETGSWTRAGDLDAILSHEGISVLVDNLNKAIDVDTTSVFQDIRIRPLSSRARSGNMLPSELSLRIPQSPVLRSIRLEHVCLCSVQELPSSPLPELKSFTLAHVEVTLPDSLFPFLDLTPNLKDLTLENCQVRSTPNLATPPRPRHSIVLARLDNSRLSSAEGVVGVNLLFRTLDMPKLRYMAFRTHSNRPWARLDWGAICHNRALQAFELAGLSSEALTRLLRRIPRLTKLSGLLLYRSALATPEDFAFQVSRRLLQPSYCLGLAHLSMYFRLTGESKQAIKELRRTRPSLNIYWEKDFESDSDFEEDAIEGEKDL